MTKRVIVMNGDTANYRVQVEVFDKGRDGEPDTLAKTVVLSNPCDMTDSSIYLTSTRYLVIKELPSTAPSPSAPG